MRAARCTDLSKLPSAFPVSAQPSHSGRLQVQIRRCPPPCFARNGALPKPPPKVPDTAAVRCTAVARARLWPVRVRAADACDPEVPPLRSFSPPHPALLRNRDRIGWIRSGSRAPPLGLPTHGSGARPIAHFEGSTPAIEKDVSLSQGITPAFFVASSQSGLFLGTKRSGPKSQIHKLL